MTAKEFNTFCVNGKLEEAMAIAPDEWSLDIDIMPAVCSHGHLEIVKALYEKYPENSTNECMALCYGSACQLGKLNILEWLYDVCDLIVFSTCSVLKFTLGPQFGNKNEGIDQLLKQKHAGVLDYGIYEERLIAQPDYEMHIDHFGDDGELVLNAEPNDVEPDDDAKKFKRLCIGGKLDEAILLAPEEWSPDIDIMMVVCGNGHFAVAKWLCDKYLENRNDACLSACFGNALISGNAELVDWLYNSIENKIIITFSTIFNIADIKKNKDIKKWLDETFDADFDEVRNRTRPNVAFGPPFIDEGGMAGAGFEIEEYKPEMDEIKEPEQPHDIYDDDGLW